MVPVRQKKRPVVERSKDNPSTKSYVRASIKSEAEGLSFEPALKRRNLARTLRDQVDTTDESTFEKTDPQLRTVIESARMGQYSNNDSNPLINLRDLDPNNTLAVDGPNWQENTENEALAKIYDELTGPFYIRWEAEEEFITSVLDRVVKRNRGDIIKVLDTCMGTGIEVSQIYHYFKDRNEGLSDKIPFEIQCNEFDSYLRAKGNNTLYAMLGKRSKDLNITSYPWQDMDKVCSADNENQLAYPNDSVHFMMCVGNSLNYLNRDIDQIESLRAWKNILHPQGKLIVDIRNWETMCREAKDILMRGEEVNQENYKYNGAPMFNGDDVKGFPVAVGEGWVRYRYLKKSTGQEAFLTMRTLTHQDMLDRFSQAGFTRVEIFSDFEPGLKEDSAYRQYVLSKD